MQTALCVGINNYPGTDADLNGCVNDAEDWSAYLKSHYPNASVVTLVDSAATKENVVAHLACQLDALLPGATCVFTFSGHGTWIPDLDGDEPDRRDEALCPYDMSETNLILDDELRVMLVGRPKGTRVFMVTDACHSGTVFRFAGPANEKRRIRYMPPSNFVKNPLTLQKMAEMSFSRTVPRSNKPLPGVVHISGCRDREFSYDADFNGKANGAMTYALMQALATGGVVTYLDLFKALENYLPSWDYPQTPVFNAAKDVRKEALFS